METSNSALPLVVNTLAAIILAWLGSIVISRYFHRRSRGLPFFRVRVVHASPYVSFEVAQRAADDRRSQLVRFLRAQGDRLTVSEQFREIPSFWTTEDLQIRTTFEGDEAAAHWESSRLLLQLERDQDLLIERVIDVLEYLLRTKKITISEFPLSTRLEKIPRKLRGDKYPWRVVIATNHPRVLTKAFSNWGIGEWVGIGVDLEFLKTKQKSPDTSGFATPSAIPTGRCRTGSDGMTGVIGGLIADGSEKFGLTCRHVLSSTCTAVKWPPNQFLRPPDNAFTEDSPDAAFIGIEEGCFLDAGPAPTRVRPLNQSEIVLAMEQDTKLTKSPRRDDKVGIVSEGEVRQIKLSGHIYRGPHVAITPYFYEQLGVVWPLFSRAFSGEGDSGSWVIDEEARAWLGMVVGALDPPNTTAYAVSAPYLLLTFARAHVDSFVTAEALV